MKKIIFIFLYFTCASYIYGQQIYWNCYNIIVDDEVSFANALDGFMQTESGKSMTPVSFSEMVNSGSNYSSTHSLCFFSPDASDLESNRSKLNNFEGGLLYGAWDSEVTVESSLLGQSLIADPSAFNLNFNVIVQIDVEDPAFYGAAFAKMKDATADLSEGVIELHEALAGQETGITHFVVGREKNMASWIDARNKLFASDAFQEFASSVRSISEVKDIHTVRLIKQYNVQ